MRKNACRYRTEAAAAGPYTRVGGIRDLCTGNRHLYDIHNHVHGRPAAVESTAPLHEPQSMARRPCVSEHRRDAVQSPRAAPFLRHERIRGIRALVGGATWILATHRMPCIHGLVRNLDFNSGFCGTTQLNLEHVVNVLELPPESNP